MKRLAQAISILFGPFVWPITLIVIVFKSRLPTQQITILLPVLLFLQVGVPYFYIFRAYKRKKISDLDITKREERYRTMAVTCVSFVLSLVVIYFFGNGLVLRLSILALSVLIINTMITFFWKISLHMTLNVISALIINYLYQWQIPFLYMSIPLIFWSRLYLKKHTIMQLIGGLAINGVLALIFIFFVL